MTHKNPEILVAAAVIVDAEGRILLARRPPGKMMAGLWEFPGGKVHENETVEAALVRELGEELGIAPAPGFRMITVVEHTYPEFALNMPMFLVTKWAGEVHPHEHEEIAWVKVDQLKEYPMPPADAPLVKDLPALLEEYR